LSDRSASKERLRINFLFLGKQRRIFGAPSKSGSYFVIVPKEMRIAILGETSQIASDF
jgi:hypothetical protein